MEKMSFPRFSILIGQNPLISNISNITCQALVKLYWIRMPSSWKIFYRKYHEYDEYHITSLSKYVILLYIAGCL